MNWDALGAIAELLGAVGVIATLLYLAKQIGQNSQMMRATIKQEQTSATQQVIYQWVDHPDLYAALKKNEDLPEEKQIQLEWIVRAGFRGFEAHCHQAELGLLDETEWAALKTTIQTFCRFPKIQEIYLGLRPQLSERLQRVIDPVIERTRNDA